MENTPEVVTEVSSCEQHPKYKGLRTKRVPCDTCSAIYEQVKSLNIKEKRAPWRKSKKTVPVESASDSVDNNVVSETPVVPVPVVAEAVCEPVEEDEVVLPEEDEFPVDDDDDDDNEEEFPDEEELPAEDDLSDML